MTIEVLEPIDLGDFSVYRNSSDEIFIEVKSSKKIFRMKDLNGDLHISCLSVSIGLKRYNSCDGVVLKKA